jgi:hypothetical protein
MRKPVKIQTFKLCPAVLPRMFIPKRQQFSATVARKFAYSFTLDPLKIASTNRPPPEYSGWKHIQDRIAIFITFGIFLSLLNFDFLQKYGLRGQMSGLLLPLLGQIIVA